MKIAGLLFRMIIVFFFFGLLLDFLFKQDVTMLYAMIRGVVIGCIYVLISQLYYRFKFKNKASNSSN